jgi:hypothetical protein
MIIVKIKYFRISKFLEKHLKIFEKKIQNVKNQKLVFGKLEAFENFQKMLDGSKFGTSCLLGISIQNSS